MFFKKKPFAKNLSIWNNFRGWFDSLPGSGIALQRIISLWHYCSLHWITLDVPKLLSSALFVVFISLISVHSRCNNGQSATTLPRYTAEHFSVCITGHWSLHQMHCILNCNVNSAPLQCVSFWNQCMQWPRAYPANRLHADITICQ